MKKILIPLIVVISLIAPSVATARPYLHLDEAQCALRGCYGSDNDVEATRIRFGYRSFNGWDGYIRYNSYDICVYASYTTAGGLYIDEPFEAYYPHSYDTSLGDIWDAHRDYVCPPYGVTQG